MILEFLVWLARLIVTPAAARVALMSATFVSAVSDKPFNAVDEDVRIITFCPVPRSIELEAPPKITSSCAPVRKIRIVAARTVKTPVLDGRQRWRSGC